MVELKDPPLVGSCKEGASVELATGIETGAGVSSNVATRLDTEEEEDVEDEGASGGGGGSTIVDDDDDDDCSSSAGFV